MVVPIISYHINIWVSYVASHLNDQKLPKVSTTVLYLETNHHNHRYNTIIIPYHYPTTYRISRFYNPTYLHGAIIPEKVFESPLLAMICGWSHQPPYRKIAICYTIHYYHTSLPIVTSSSYTLNHMLSLRIEMNM